MHFPVPAPGDVVWIRQRRWRVERARRDRNVVRLDVTSRDERLTFLAPFDRPATVERAERARHVRAQQAAARLAHMVGRAYGLHSIASATDAGIDILPHQLEPALATVAGARRVLLADEVGLGKTIQAGLAVAEIHRRAPLARTLIVVPASLRDQWIDELGRRFRIECLAADRYGLDALARQGAYGENPWRRPGVWITSFDYVKQRHVRESLPPDPWSLVVIDEAHVACGDSERHDACVEMAQRARHVMLLTATPHSGDEARFTRLIELGRLAGADPPLVVFRRTRAGLGLDLDRRVRWHSVGLSDAETRLLQVLTAFEAAALRTAGAAHHDAALLLLSVFRKRALSTMGALAVSLDRRLAWLGDAQQAGDFEWLQPRLGFEDDSDEVDDIERQSLTGDIGLGPGQERSWLRRLRGLAEAAGRVESKVTRIASLVGRAHEPVVVFTEFRHSLEVLRRRLHFGNPVAELHGGLTLAERRHQLGRFLDGTASVLLATDVGGQGLNLQDRARWVISLELPWNPARLEQRCGRVDRIGQTRRVHFTLVVARHASEAGLLARLARRAMVARRSLGDDVLRTAVPNVAALGAAIFEDASLDDTAPASAALPVCRSWVRSARVLSRRLLTNRALTRHWRAPDADATGSCWTSVRRLPAIRRATTDRSLLVFSVPIVDESGRVVERHVVAVRVEPPDRLGLDRDVVDAARLEATRAVASRARRIGVRLRRRLDANLRLETALAARVVARLTPEEIQPGLFDRRELRALDAAQHDTADIEREVEGRLADRRRETEISVGRAVLELRFLADR